MSWQVPALAGLVVLVADQVSKEWIMALGTPRASAPVGSSFVAIRAGLNRRGPPLDNRLPVLFALWVAALALAVLALAQGWPRDASIGPLGVGAAFGGATGNLLDRVRRGGIVDFIAIGRLPACNLADMAMIAGVALAIFAMW
jgi:signal peptidase II